jgi:hypothetical protein
MSEYDEDFIVQKEQCLRKEGSGHLKEVLKTYLRNETISGTNLCNQIKIIQIMLMQDIS